MISWTFVILEDFEWVPPSEAEMKVIEARRERTDKISQLMGEYLLKGYKMLGIVCDICEVRPRVDMTLHLETSFWFRAKQSLPFLLNAACLAEKQHIPIY
jgi:hypothetical protein